jgi:RNA polymerase sigma-70 factor (ECF subfamily)
MAGTGYTVYGHPDWQSGLRIRGVPQPMRNDSHDPSRTAPADATLSDEELMLELAHGRHEALGSLYSRHSRLVFYLALQSLERPAAEELVQEVFLTIWRGASAFDPEQGSFRPWLLRLAHWRILNELRRRHRRPQVQRNVDEEDELFQQVLDQEPGPEERAFQKEHRRIVDSALEALPPKQREAVALAFLEDMTHEQVAEALDVPLGTAKTRIRSGLHSLRMVLAPVAASLFGLGFAVVGVRYMQTQTTLDRDERALTLVTMSELAPLRLGAVTSDLPAGAHANYRGRAGSSLAVLTAEGLPAPSGGKTYQAWVLQSDRWTSVGTFMPDADGTVRLIAENAVLASSPNAVEVTLETAGGSQTPSDTVVLRWLPT